MESSNKNTEQLKKALEKTSNCQTKKELANRIKDMENNKTIKK